MATNSQRCEGDSGEGEGRAEKGAGGRNQNRCGYYRLFYAHCCETLDRLFCYLTEY